MSRLWRRYGLGGLPPWAPDVPWYIYGWLDVRCMGWSSLIVHMSRHPPMKRRFPPQSSCWIRLHFIHHINAYINSFCTKMLKLTLNGFHKMIKTLEGKLRWLARSHGGKMWTMVGLGPQSWWYPHFIKSILTFHCQAILDNWRRYIAREFTT